MKKTNKYISIGLMVLLMLGGVFLVSCGGSQEEAAPEAAEESTETTAEEPAPEVEQAFEEVEEAEEAEEALDDGGLDPEATGFEEDPGSPFAPGKGLKVAPTRVASAGWVDTSTITEDATMMRIIEESEQEIVVIHQLSSPTGLSTLIVSPSEYYFTRVNENQIESSPIERSTPLVLQAALNGFESTDQLVEQSIQLVCDRCTQGGTQETLVILWPASGLTLTMDRGEIVPEATALLTPLRLEHDALLRSTSLRITP
ncbi:MAG: hypothetical protein QNJ45_21490 [Ardenticatenaceae bacterium]|nr:hypothetical protein [Ardenticatenaceae bacterium]